MLIFSHAPRLEAVIMIREVPGEAASMSDGSPAVPDIWVGGDRFTPSTQGISQLSQRVRRRASPRFGETGRFSWQQREEVLRVSSQ